MALGYSKSKGFPGFYMSKKYIILIIMQHVMCYCAHSINYQHADL